MNWKAALIGAVVVILAGFGVGLATGGGGSTGDRSTVTRTVTEGRSGGSTPKGDTGSSEGEDTPVQYLAEAVDPNSDNMFSIETPAEARIGHQTFPNSVTVDELFLRYCGDHATIEYPVDSARARFVGALGWTPDSSSEASAAMEIHADRADGPLLYRHAFDGLGEAVNVRVPLRGAVSAIFVWIAPSTSCDDQTTFVLGNARFVG